MDEMKKKQLEGLAKQYGLDLAKWGGLAFAMWLLSRPRVAARPRLARFLYWLTGKGGMP